jgi:hypothetical protein
LAWGWPFFSAIIKSNSLSSREARLSPDKGSQQSIDLNQSIRTDARKVSMRDTFP